MQQKARRCNTMILTLMKISKACTSCGKIMDESVVRPHLVDNKYGPTIICGDCHGKGEYGKPVTLYQHGTRPEKAR